MNPTLQQLWRDNAEAIFQRHTNSQSIRELSDLIERNRNKLCEQLTDQQKEILQTYDDCHAEVEDLYYEQVFEGAFCLGVRLAAAGLLQD